MSAHTASHDAHAAHEEHGHAGVDPMVIKMGVLFTAVVLIVGMVTVFSYSTPTLAGIMPAKAKNPVILPAQTPAQLANACDHFVFEYIISGYRKCK